MKQTVALANPSSEARILKSMATMAMEFVLLATMRSASITTCSVGTLSKLAIALTIAWSVTSLSSIDPAAVSILRRRSPSPPPSPMVVLPRSTVPPISMPENVLDGARVGCAVGTVDGLRDGLTVGTKVGFLDGAVDGVIVGDALGDIVGALVGTVVGTVLGALLGNNVGIADGETDMIGAEEGAEVSIVGDELGDSVRMKLQVNFLMECPVFSHTYRSSPRACNDETTVKYETPPLNASEILPPTVDTIPVVAFMNRIFGLLYTATNIFPVLSKVMLVLVVRKPVDVAATSSREFAPPLASPA